MFDFNIINPLFLASKNVIISVQKSLLSNDFNFIFIF